MKVYFGFYFFILLTTILLNIPGAIMSHPAINKPADSLLTVHIKGIEVPEDVVNQICLIEVKYFGFDSEIHSGTLIVNKKIQNEVKEIFNELLEIKFPIERIEPMENYKWNDDTSMTDNNTSAFNYRLIANSNTLSKHSLGIAIDINPKYNPYIKNGKMDPINGSYNENNKGTILPDSNVVRIFKKYEWIWGGDWTSVKDYQHFEK